MTHKENCYHLVLADLKIKGDISRAMSELQEREEKEDYEGCAGIKKAIDEFSKLQEQTK